MSVLVNSGESFNVLKNDERWKILIRASSTGVRSGCLLTDLRESKDLVSFEGRNLLQGLAIARLSSCKFNLLERLYEIISLTKAVAIPPKQTFQVCKDLKVKHCPYPGWV